MPFTLISCLKPGSAHYRSDWRTLLASLLVSGCCYSVLLQSDCIVVPQAANMFAQVVHSDLVQRWNKIQSIHCSLNKQETQQNDDNCVISTPDEVRVTDKCVVATPDKVRVNDKCVISKPDEVRVNDKCVISSPDDVRVIWHTKQLTAVMYILVYDVIKSMCQ